MSNRIASFLLALLVSSAAGCDDGGPVVIATYNAGLAVSFVPYANERAPHIMSDFPADELDVVCVQEFWDQVFWDQLTTATAAELPHTFRRPNEVETGGSASCAGGDLDAVDVCVRSMCPMATPETLVDCALAMCATEVSELPTDCLNCLVGNVSIGDLDVIRTTCESGAGSAYAYDDSFGTGILSRYPLAETDSLLLESTANRRAVLYARIPDTPQGDVHFFCTHLTSNLSSVPYTGSFAGWPEEQAAQIEAFLAFANDKAGANGQRIFAGDFNSGPALPGITEELPGNYAMWLAAGMRNPYAEQASAICTYCDANPLNLGTMGGDGGLIDHIFVDESVAPAVGRRFLDGTVSIEAEGMMFDTAYSDHYGLALTVGE